MAFLSFRAPYQIKIVYLAIFSPQNHALHKKLQWLEHFQTISEHAIKIFSKKT